MASNLRLTFLGSYIFSYSVPIILYYLDRFPFSEIHSLSSLLISFILEVDWNYLRLEQSNFFKVWTYCFIFLRKRNIWKVELSALHNLTQSWESVVDNIFGESMKYAVSKILIWLYYSLYSFLCFIKATNKI